MDSINKNQPEHNRENLHSADAVNKIKELVKGAPNCFFVTVPDSGDPHSRPMNVRQVDDQGNLWFLSAKDSHKNHELQNDFSVDLYFQGSTHSDFVHLRGTASIFTDKAKIKELWEPTIKTWFTEGVDDPRISVIRFSPSSGYYWDTKHGNFVAGIKMMIGAAIGKTLDDSIEGKLKP
jgi:general stress protein 26